MYNGLKTMGVIARQSIKGALANYLGVAIGFFTTFFVLTRCLTEEEIGLTRVMVDAAMLFSGLAQLGTNASIIRFFPHFRNDRDNHGIFGLSLLLPLAGFLLFALIFLIFHNPLQALYASKSPLMADYFYMLPMLTFFALYMTVFETNASVLMRITVPKLVREVGVRLFNLAAYLLYGYGLVSLDVFVWMFCGSYALAMVLNLMYLISLGHISFRIDWQFLTRERVKEIIRYTLFMTATVLAGNIPLFNSLFLGAKTGLALTGVYTIAFYIANVVEVPYRRFVCGRHGCGVVAGNGQGGQFLSLHWHRCAQLFPPLSSCTVFHRRPHRLGHRPECMADRVMGHQRRRCCHTAVLWSLFPVAALLSVAAAGREPLLVRTTQSGCYHGRRLRPQRAVVPLVDARHYTPPDTRHTFGRCSVEDTCFGSGIGCGYLCVEGIADSQWDYR